MDIPDSFPLSCFKNNPVAALTVTVLTVLLLLLALPWPFDVSVSLPDGRFVRLVDGTSGINITAITAAGNGVWAGTASGSLYSLSPDRVSAAPLDSFKMDGAVVALYPTDLNIWGGFNGGAFLITGNSGRMLPLPIGGSRLNVTAFVTGTNRMWVGTDKGLLSYDFSSWSAHPAPVYLGTVKINSLVLQGETLLAGTDRGLFKVTDNWASVDLNNGGKLAESQITQPEVFSIVLFPDGVSACGTDRGLLFVEKDGNVRPGNGVSGSVNAITLAGDSIYVAGSDGLFVGAYNVLFKRINGLPYNSINVLGSDNKFVWLGTDRGLFSYELSPSGRTSVSVAGNLTGAQIVNPDLWSRNGKVSSVFRMPPAYAKQQIFFVKANQEKGIVWCGTEQGAFRFDRSGTFLEHRNNRNGLPDNKVHVIDFNNDKTWFGTMGGLALLENGQWSSFTRQDGTLLDNNVWALYSTVEGLWVGTDGGLQFRGNDGKWKSWTIKDSPLPENWIGSITSNSKGVVFVGIWNGGVAVFEQGSNTRTADIKILRDPDDQPGIDLAFNDGLISDAVASVVVDNNDHLWAATAKGLCRFDGTNWYDYIHRDWSIAGNPLNYLEVGKDTKTIVVCGSDSFSIVHGSRFRNYSSPGGSGKAILVVEGDVSVSGSVKTTWIDGEFPSDYIWTAGIIDNFMVLGTSDGLFALNFGSAAK